jgi:hypothetical protein
MGATGDDEGDAPKSEDRRGEGDLAAIALLIYFVALILVVVALLVLPAIL